jgi:hypothetical protein
MEWRKENSNKYFRMRGKRADFIGENAGKIFERRTTGEAENRIFERGKRGVATDGATANHLRMTAKQWKSATAQYLSGKEWAAIASDLSVPINTLRSRACREGITKVKAQMQTVCIEKKTQSLESLSALVRSKLAADAASTLERIESYDLDGIKDESLREGILQSVSKRSALVFGWSEGNESTSVSINLLGSMPDRFAEVVVSNPV